MNKLDYISKQFSKAQHKKYEHYVVTRIWHLLNDLSLKFVTQQYISRPDGRAMTDMFFPQLKLHIEVDEGYHKKDKQIEWDKLREIDIINITNHEILRVDVTKDIKDVNLRINEIVNIIKEKKQNVDNFSEWDIDYEQNPHKYIDKGSINIDDDCSFKNMIDAVSCFGRKYKGIWRGGVNHPKEDNKFIWFPKLYKNKGWNNTISNDENIIIEIKLENPQEHILNVLNNKSNIQRIVFSHVKSPLGDTMYRYKGLYKLDKDETSIDKGLVWKRIESTSKTYQYLD